MTYDYDDENRLITWTKYAVGPSSPQTGDSRSDFYYDGLGRLRERMDPVLQCTNVISDDSANRGGMGPFVEAIS